MLKKVLFLRSEIVFFSVQYIVAIVTSAFEVKKHLCADIKHAKKRRYLNKIKGR